MALTLESAGKVRSKTREHLLQSKGAFYAFKALFLALSEYGNVDLAFKAIDGTLADDSGGVVLSDAACTLYGVYAKKVNANGKSAGTATDAYLVIFDDATDDAGAGTDGRIVLPFLETTSESFWINPTGLTLAAGCVAKSYTDFDGTTDSSAGDAPYGFAILGA